jgi:hypothetical protein
VGSNPTLSAIIKFDCKTACFDPTGVWRYKRSKKAVA